MSEEKKNPQQCDAAYARWGGIVDQAHGEAAGHGVLMNRLAREQITTFAPIGASGPIDCVAANADGECAPIQMKAIASSGLTIWTKYLAWPKLRIVYVTLGHTDGGAAPETVIRVLSAQEACDLAVRFSGSRNSESRYDPERHSTYRWPRETVALREALEPHTARRNGDLSRLLGLG